MNFMSTRAYRVLERRIGIGPAHVYCYARKLGTSAEEALFWARSEFNQNRPVSTKKLIDIMIRVIRSVNNHDQD